MKFIYRIIIAGFIFAFHSVCIAQQWTALGTGTNSSRVNVLITDSVGNLYAGGDFYKAGGISAEAIAKWNGSEWNALGSGVDGQVLVLKILDGNLFVGGEFVNAGAQQVNCIAMWDGNQWKGFGEGMIKTGAHTFTTSVRDIVMYRGELHAAGIFDYADGKKASLIARWTGTTWEPVGTGITGTYVNALAVYNDELYAGGNFTSAGGSAAKNIAKWDGTSWSAIGQGFNNFVNVLKVNNGILYAAGSFTASGTDEVKYIATLNGQSWAPLASSTNNDVSSLAFKNNTLIAGGYFTMAGEKPVNRIAVFDGANWMPIGTGVDDFVKVVYLDSASEILYAGGSFVKAGTATVNHIAMTQLITGIREENTHLLKTTIYPQPALHEVTIKLPSDHGFIPYSVRIVNIAGEAVQATYEATNNTILIKRNKLPAGIYFYSVYGYSDVVDRGIIYFE